jgi:chlorobactene glucosyltransferase
LFLIPIAAIFSILSALGSVSMLVYLYSTEKKAPKFVESLTKAGESELANSPLVSVVVTAKNEEQNIGNCLNSLTAQTYHNLELIVIDDSSTDGTASVVREIAKTNDKIRIFAAGEKPPNWAGKTWACQNGYEHSSAEILLFVDADSTFDPKTIELVLSYFTTNSIDMFSISPKVKLIGIWSNAIMPLLAGAINLLYPISKVNNPNSDRAYVFGTFVLVKRNTYEKIGGHEKVKNRLVEDAAIAHNAKSAGAKLRVERDGEFVNTDWESDLTSVYHGLERVFSDSIRPYGLISLLNAILVFFLGIFPLTVLIGYAYLYLISKVDFVANIALIFSIASIGCFLLLAARELKQISTEIGPYPLLYPLGCLIFIAAIISASVKIYLRRGFEWKGTRYSGDVLFE